MVDDVIVRRRDVRLLSRCSEERISTIQQSRSSTGTPALPPSLPPPSLPPFFPQNKLIYFYLLALNPKFHQDKNKKYSIFLCCPPFSLLISPVVNSYFSSLF